MNFYRCDIGKHKYHSVFFFLWEKELSRRERGRDTRLATLAKNCLECSLYIWQGFIRCVCSAGKDSEAALTGGSDR